MEKITIKLDTELDEQIMKYAALKKVNKSQAIRELITAGIDVTANESEILKEIKSLRADVRDNHSFNKKGFDRLASLTVKNGIKIFSIWHLVLIQIFLRSKDKGLDDSLCVQSRDEAMKTATSFGIDEYKNSKSDI
ncbi:ribbon-helix-helix protein, CopG family [Aliarcobacter cryaerophilus]|uniref:ribbon-helix-helix protein, CopG family n=1 Tax=Aliarcobacter cryaerophilus TaxID=28198 RepID=UPI003DA4E8FB